MSDQYIIEHFCFRVQIRKIAGFEEHKGETEFSFFSELIYSTFFFFLSRSNAGLVRHPNYAEADILPLVPSVKYTVVWLRCTLLSNKTDMNQLLPSLKLDLRNAYIVQVQKPKHFSRTFLEMIKQTLLICRGANLEIEFINSVFPALVFYSTYEDYILYSILWV